MFRARSVNLEYCNRLQNPGPSLSFLRLPQRGFGHALGALGRAALAAGFSLGFEDSGFTERSLRVGRVIIPFAMAWLLVFESSFAMGPRRPGNAPSLNDSVVPNCQANDRELGDWELGDWELGDWDEACCAWPKWFRNAPSKSEALLPKDDRPHILENSTRHELPSDIALDQMQGYKGILKTGVTPKELHQEGVYIVESVVKFCRWHVVVLVSKDFFDLRRITDLTVSFQNLEDLESQRIWDTRPIRTQIDG